MEVSKNFVIQEFVPPEIYSRFGVNSTWFIDNRLIDIAQFIRDKINRPVTINNWHTGGSYSESGYRLQSSQTGSEFSQHKHKAAIDVKVQSMNPYDVLNFINENWVTLRGMGLTTVENVLFTRSWNHLDLRTWSNWEGKLKTVKP